MKKALLILGMIWFSVSAQAQTIEKVSFPKSAGIERADVYVSHIVSHPRAVLVLCPGQNWNGRDRLMQEEWKRFAKENNLALAAISFASDDASIHSGGGYFDASAGAGEYLVSGIRKACGSDLPLLLYGFSGGAHFVNSFVNWKSGSVLAFCAYSAGWWEAPVGDNPGQPGIVACGANDPERCAATQTFFSQARADGRAWTWLNLRDTGHQERKELDEFVRSYFATILNAKPGEAAGEWRDVDTKKSLSPAEAKAQPTLACWLPNSKLAEAWAALHQP